MILVSMEKQELFIGIPEDSKAKDRGQQGDFAAENKACLSILSISSHSQHHSLDECRCYGSTVKEIIGRWTD